LSVNFQKMYLNHIALTVGDSEEIENFYEDILSFKLKYRFLMDVETGLKFFNRKKETEVYFMEYDGVGLEIFLFPEKGKKLFLHICLEYPEATFIYYKAKKHGYKTVVKINPGRNDTYFIWDKSGNMFEIKEIRE
jgi:catechol 2,3-dioxygenase-like lactoylglutathione lyase family enzyme